MSSKSRLLYFVAILTLLGLLVTTRAWLGAAIFSLLTWTYNIAHFVKAEVYFTGAKQTSRAYYSPVLAFAWFTLCLFPVGILHSQTIVFAITLALAALVLRFGSWRLLAAGDVKLPILTLFLIGETLVWTGYGPYMSDSFRVGVYILHIGAASFYHYLSSYFFAESNPNRPRIWSLSTTSILLINTAVISAGIACAWLPALRSLAPILGVSSFTVWVALHLAASDLLPWWRQHGPS
ncbi:MAG: hypothetical protein KGK08_13590 [Acidobacteriota bacterium]|nr:hypothetical protein [Acidobacteriota bacterium]